MYAKWHLTALYKRRQMSLELDVKDSAAHTRWINNIIGTSKSWSGCTDVFNFRLSIPTLHLIL